MTSQELKELVKLHFSLTEAKFGELKDINGAFTLLFEGDVLEVGKEVKVRTTEGQELTAPDGYHELEGGMVIKVEGGKVVEIAEKPAEEAEGEEMVEETPVEGVIEEKMEEVSVTADVEPEVAPVVEEVAKAVIEAVKGEIEAMKKEMAEMKKKMAEIEEAPATEKATPAAMSKKQPKADVFNKARYEAVVANRK